MTLSPADRQLLRDAFTARIGPTVLPANATIDDLCRNLVLAIPALLETCDALETRARTLADAINPEAAYLKREADGTWMWPYDSTDNEARLLANERTDLATAQKHIATLTAQLESDPCP